MDIRQWLDDTADRAPPDEPEKNGIGIADFLRPRADAAFEEIRPQYRRNKRRVSSDSSLIVPRCVSDAPHRPKKSLARTNSAESGEAHPVARSHSRRSSEPIEIARPSKSYERRPRHKTKTDRYESKPKKDRRQRETHEEGRVSKRRKSHRTGDGERTTGLVQSFQLKNGPKNNRLTLKPETNAGVFRHGRTSVQVTGRGTGLPDLVFNEMRFLQKPKDHQDTPQDDGAPRPTVKKNRQAQRDGEISAYFGAKKADSPDHIVEQHKTDKTLTAEQQRLPSQGARRRRKDRDAAPPSVDLPDKPFLGFGSRGERHDSNHDVLESQSHHTWSESDPIAYLPAELRAFRVASVDIGQLSAPRAQPDQGKVSGTTARRASTNRPRHDARSPRLSIHHRPPRSVADDAMQEEVCTAKPASQSLPRSSSLQRGLATLKQSHLQSRRSSMDDHNTSDILKVHPPDRMMTQGPSSPKLDRQNDAHLNKENMNPESSSPIAKLLAQAQRAVRPLKARAIVAAQDCEEEQNTQKTRAVACRPSRQHSQNGLLQVQTDARHSGHATQPFTYPQRHASVAAQARPGPDHATEKRRQQVARLDPQPRSRQRQAAAYPGYESMHRDGPKPSPAYVEEQQVYASAQQAEDLVYGVESDRVSASYDLEAASTLVEEDARNEHSEPSFAHPLQDQRYGPSVGGEIDANDDFAGFWKPNKLY